MFRILAWGWAVFAALTALTFIAASLSPGSAWIPKPWFLLLLSLVLIISTFGVAIAIAFRAIIARFRSKQAD
jgi:hypothetical protein